MHDSNYGFGQRQAITRQGLQAMHGLPESPFDDASSHDGSGSQRRRRIVLGIAIVALMLGGTFVFVKGFGRTLNQYWSSDTGYPSIEDAYKRSGSIDMVHRGTGVALASSLIPLARSSVCTAKLPRSI